MIKEFRASSATFKSHIGIAIFALVAMILFYLVLEVVPAMLIGFAILWTVMAFWSKDRVLITLHEEYIEAKEAIASKKKLIKYKDIDRVEVHKTGKQLTLFLKGDGNKKEKIAINVIEKSEKDEFIALLTSKI